MSRTQSRTQVRPSSDLPPKKWTWLSCFQLHLDRADIADGGVATGSVVEALDVGKDITFGFCPCFILPVVDEFSFESVEEALHRGIVIAVALAAHQCPEAGGLDHLAILRRGILGGFNRSSQRFKMRRR